MSQLRRERTFQNTPAALVAGMGLVALAVVGRAVRRRPTHRGLGLPAVSRAALAAYLHNHLAGADAATEVVERLQRTCAGRPEERLFESLQPRFRHEKQVVERLLSELDESTGSAKRAVGSLAGKALRAIADDGADGVSLFQALEGLAIGVQGKRCMWRALQAAKPSMGRELRFLAMDAVRQWEEIENLRLALASQIFRPRSEWAVTPE